MRYQKYYTRAFYNNIGLKQNFIVSLASNQNFVKLQNKNVHVF